MLQNGDFNYYICVYEMICLLIEWILCWHYYLSYDRLIHVKRAGVSPSNERWIYLSPGIYKDKCVIFSSFVIASLGS